MGIAVKSYLDELAGHPDPTSEEARDVAKDKGPEEWFLHSLDVKGDLDMAFRLWDAVSWIETIVKICIRRWGFTDLMVY